MKNKKILALAALAFAAAFPAQALDSSVVRQLKALDIVERREQRSTWRPWRASPRSSRATGPTR
jgi:hypothetical protein